MFVENEESKDEKKESLTEEKEDTEDIDLTDESDPVDGEDLEDIQEDAEPDEDEFFEFDEEGNIIIHEEEPEEESEEKSEEEPEEEKSNEESSEDGAESGEASEESADPSDPREATIETLRRELEDLRSLGRDVLKELGIESEDVQEGLLRFAAEAAEKSPEEYRKEREERQRTENAERMARRIAFEEKMRKDLSEVHAAYPDAREYDSVMKLPNFERFAQYRDLGLPPKEAYAAANPDRIRAGAANAARRQALPETKKHMRSAVPKSSKDTSVTMTKQELHSWKEMLPNLTDKEIISLYKKTAPKKS